jgi:alcohol dehydrogenase YqhD (iron-dependent ADH family)
MQYVVILKDGQILIVLGFRIVTSLLYTLLFVSRKYLEEQDEYVRRSNLFLCATKTAEN